MLKFPHLSKFKWNNSDRELIQDIFTHSEDEYSYINNYLFVLQAARDEPYKYYDGENFFILCKAREFNIEKMIILPIGLNVHNKIYDVCKEYYNQYKEDILIKKIDNSLKQKLLLKKENFKEIQLDNYREEKDISRLPDDVFPECIIKLKKIFYEDDVENINGYNNQVYKLQKKSISQRFRTFRNKFNNGEVFSVSELNSKEDGKEVKQLIEKWSESLKKRLKINENDRNNPLNNASYFLSPYQSMIDFVCDYNEKSIEKNYFSYLMKIDGKLVAASIYGKTYRNTCGQYLNIALTDDKKLYNASEFCMIVALSDLLKTYKIEYVNCGGSEYKGLHDFILKFNPIQRDRYYLKYSK